MPNPIILTTHSFASTRFYSSSASILPRPVFRGVCISSDVGPVCECRNIDWHGKFCHIGEHIGSVGSAKYKWASGMKLWVQNVSRKFFVILCVVYSVQNVHDLFSTKWMCQCWVWVQYVLHWISTKCLSTKCSSLVQLWVQNVCTNVLLFMSGGGGTGWQLLDIIMTEAKI